MTSSTKGKTPVGRVSYPHLFTPQKDNKSGKETYSVVLMFPKTTDLSAMKAAVEAAIVAKWPNKRPKGLKSPFRDGDELDDDGERKKGPEYKGMVYISFRANADRRPQVVDRNVERVTKESGKLYPGCYAIVSYSAFGYDTDGSVGTSFGLNNLQIVRDGDRLDSRTDAEDDFTAIEDEANEAMF